MIDTTPKDLVKGFPSSFCGQLLSAGNYKSLLKGERGIYGAVGD